MSDDRSARLALPLLAAGQAQKEVSHNEGLALLDMLVQPAVVDAYVDTPPSDPEAGECWIVGDTPSGDWAGHPGALAAWTTGGWRFAAPVEGMTAWVIAASCHARFAESAWSSGKLVGEQLLIAGVQVVGEQGAAIADPAGGSVIDAEGRTAILSILAALRDHGLIAG